MITKRHNQRGAAIIVALFVVALVAAVATLMLDRIQIQIRRTELILNANRADLLAEGSVAWALDLLTQNGLKAEPNTVVDRTPIEAPLSTVNGARIKSKLYDAQGFFNINNLSDASYQTQFIQLIHVLFPSLDLTEVENITLATADWIFTGAKTPALDEYYLKLSPPYRAAHRLMSSASELRMVKGVTASLFTQLSPFLVALPTSTPININNTQVPVLMSLSKTLSSEAAKGLIARAQKTPFKNTEEFLNLDIIKTNPIDAAKITTVSNYFLLETNVKLGHQESVLYTLLHRKGQGKETKTVVLWQSKGTL